MIFLLPFLKVNALAHFTLSLTLYLIHVFISSLNSYFVFKAVSEALSIPRLEECYEKKILALK